ncbi:MAG: hypothetical protein DWB48_07145, partial [Nitrosomonas sp.]|nr:hypothetical protein [Nitrosomonas sp.]
ALLVLIGTYSGRLAVRGPEDWRFVRRSAERLVAAEPAEAWGWYVLGGAACILFGIVGLFIPVLMNVENNSASGQVELTHSPEEGT